MKKFLKNNIKLILVFISGIVISSGITAYAVNNYMSEQIRYQNNTFAINSVSEALDDLYSYSKEKIDNNTSNNYSTEEQVVGTWIDGKPIYQRSLKMADTYTSEVPIKTGSGVPVTGITDVFMSTIKPNLDQIIETIMQTNNSMGGSAKHHQYAHRIDFNNGYVAAYDNYDVGYMNYALYPGTVITIRYTKITDTATS